MPTAYRIFKTKFADVWYDGAGAYRYGGRWNSRGTRILYAAEHLSLAALEILVSANSSSLLTAFSYAEIEFDETYVLSVEEITTLPKNWNALPAPNKIRLIGDKWVKSNVSPILKVPAAVVPNEYNYLLNIAHTDFAKINLGKARPFAFDQRLNKR